MEAIFFDEFIDWLKEDGLRPKTSERLWKKKILINLIANNKKTIENYKDFLLHRKTQELIGAKIYFTDRDELVFKNQSNQIPYKSYIVGAVKINHLKIILLCNNSKSIAINKDEMDLFLEHIMIEYKRR